MRYIFLSFTHARKHAHTRITHTHAHARTGSTSGTAKAVRWSSLWGGARRWWGRWPGQWQWGLPWYSTNYLSMCHDLCHLGLRRERTISMCGSVLAINGGLRQGYAGMSMRVRKWTTFSRGTNAFRLPHCTHTPGALSVRRNPPGEAWGQVCPVSCMYPGK